MKKKFITIILELSLCASIAGCAKQSDISIVNTEATQTETTSDGAILSNINISSGKIESVGEADTFIELGNNVTVNGEGATVENNKVTITSAGTYSIKGPLADESTDEPNSAIFSKSDITFIGNGSLTVDVKYNNGITSKDDLQIQVVILL